MVPKLVAMTICVLVTAQATAGEIVSKFCTSGDGEVIKLAEPSQRYTYSRWFSGQRTTEQGTFSVDAAGSHLRFGGTALAALGIGERNANRTIITFKFRNRYSSNIVSVEYSKRRCETFP